MAASTHTRPYLVGLIGAGIGGSLSPALHEHEASCLGLAYAYRVLDIDALGVAPTASGDLLEQAREAGFDGLNVTHPCKQLVLERSEHFVTCDRHDASPFRTQGPPTEHRGWRRGQLDDGLASPRS